MKKGFVALTTVVITSTLLMAFVTYQSIESLHFFDAVAQKKYRVMSYYFANICIDQAILGLAHDYFYLSTTPRRLKDFHCVIDSVIKNGNERIISVHGDYQHVKVFRKARVDLTPTSLNLLSVE